jgi:hypothetical protein
MIWQCSTCLHKFFANPTGAQFSLSQNMAQPPICMTICNKGLELNYTFPELRAIETRPGADKGWHKIWPVKENGTNYTSDTFLTVSQQNNLKFCQTINLEGGVLSEVKVRHNYSITCKLNQVEVNLHSLGQLHSATSSLVIPKHIFTSEQNFILQLSMETMKFLPSPDFNCSLEEELQALDSCLFTEAFRAANNSVGCLSKIFM